MFAIIVAFVVFIAVNELISPAPLAANPILVLSFVHAKVPPVGVFANTVAGTNVLLQ